MASSDIWVRCLCIFLSFEIVVVSPLASFAASDSSAALSYVDLVKLGESEKLLFGSAHKNLPSSERIQALEIELFGGKHQGTYHNRIVAIQSALASGKTNLLMPPMAAELDRSANAAVSSQAPLPGADSTRPDSEEATASAGSDERVKEILHQALKQYSTGQYSEAEASFKQVLKLDKSNTDAYFNLGAMAESRGDLKAALNYYKSASKIDPGDGDIQRAVNGVESKLADLSVKTTVSSEMPKPAPSFANAIRNRNNLKEQINDASAAYKSGNYNRAIEILRKVAAAAPDEASVQYALSQCYKGKHQYMEARSSLRNALSLDPGNQMYRDALSDLDRHLTSSGDGAATSSSYDAIASDSGAGSVSGNGPVGQITPFSGVDATPGWQSTGRTGAYAFSGSRTPGFFGGGIGSPFGSSRIQRVAIGGISGAAIGALFGGGYRSRGRSALVGGAIGGLFGLLSGR
jgi:tetratricopeptide (TPR) repeat protein